MKYIKEVTLYLFSMPVSNVKYLPKKAVAFPSQSRQKTITKPKNWRWQLQHQIRSPQGLLAWLQEKHLYERLSPKNQADLENWQNSYSLWENQFRFAVTPYYLGLVDWEAKNCPVLRQILPSPAEFHNKATESLDPLQEESYMPLPSLTHRYPDRVLWYLSHQCAVYCRFCMRKRKVSKPSSAPNRKGWEEIFSYIARRSSIKEVILSGGDPLSLNDASIDHILQRLRAIPHLYSIRIHSRMPVTLPMRITPSLAQILKNAYPITIVTHFNHARELQSQEAKDAVRLLRMNGCHVLNQSVLLKDINDTASLQEDLLLQLLAVGIVPYYLHRCDEIQGTSHFRVPLQRGIEILQELRGKNPGIALPRYVVDLNGGGKIPLEPNYWIREKQVREHQKSYYLRNWDGQVHQIHET